MISRMPSAWECWNVACTSSSRMTNHGAKPVQARPESDLIADSRNGDNEAMAELFSRHYSFSIAVARRILRGPEDALDAVQSAYLSAFQHFNSFRGEASFKTWITRIVLNDCLMRLREPARHRIVISLDDPGLGGRFLAIPGNGPTPEDLALRREINRAVADAVAQLPKPLSEVFTRCGISGLSIRDAAEALGLTVAAAKTRLFRARALMRQELQRVFAAGIDPSASRLAVRS